METKQNRHFKPLWLLVLSAALMLAGCYNRPSHTPDGFVPTEHQMDSISFYTTHHYTNDYNFLVVGDSLRLAVTSPLETLAELTPDSVTAIHGDRLVVVEIAHVPADETDTTWVKLARDAETIGWVRECEMLVVVSPDNPISQFIDFFSDTHLLFMLAIVVAGIAAFVVWRLYRRNARIVHFRDIDSFYPALLALLVAAAAVFYSTIQLADPESWRHFYYHPSVNPFSVPLHLALFLATVWLLVIVALAAIYDVFRCLPAGEAVAYCLGLAAICSVAYMLFSVATLYYVGYPLFAAYTVWAVVKHYRGHSAHYRCGRCGAPMRTKGECPQCGAVNV